MSLISGMDKQAFTQALASDPGNLVVLRLVVVRKILRKTDSMYRQFLKGKRLLCNLLSLKVFVRKFCD